MNFNRKLTQTSPSSAAVSVPKLGAECPPKDEDEKLRELFTFEMGELQKILLNSKDLVPRQQHSKQFGCVWADFTVEKNLPDDVRQGVFKDPKTFSAWIRFSSFKEEIDQKGDMSYGMAIKLMDVETNEGDIKATQDFLLVNFHTFPLKNVDEYIVFRRESVEICKPFRVALRRCPLHISVLEPWIVARMFMNRILKRNNPLENNPLAVKYWSTVPYRLGTERIRQSWSTNPYEPCLQAVKYFVKPHLPQNRLNTKGPKSENYLREALSAFLNQKDAYFDFYVQLQTDPVRMPIEDPRIEWRGAQECKVATIKIPAQVFDSPEQLEFGEHLSFTPWHCLSAHQPLGGINRARQQVYQASSLLRHQENNVLEQEPTECYSKQFRRLLDVPQPQKALTVLVPIKQEESKNLETTLSKMSEGIKAALRKDSPSTHFARWVIVEDPSQEVPRTDWLVNFFRLMRYIFWDAWFQRLCGITPTPPRKTNPPEERCKPHLLFISNYDGHYDENHDRNPDRDDDWQFDNYLPELVRAIGKERINEIWSHCEGYDSNIWKPCGEYDPAKDDLSKLADFFHRHEFKAQVFGVALPGRTVKIIKHRHRVRQLLNELLDSLYSKLDHPYVKDLQKLLLQRSPDTDLHNRQSGVEKRASVFSSFGSIFETAMVWVIQKYVGIKKGYTEPEKRHNPYPDRLQQIKKKEDRSAQNEMTILVAIKPGFFRWWGLLPFVFRLTRYRMNRGTSTIMKLKTIHFARWVVLKRQRIGNPQFNYLLFESNYNGSWDSYIDDFINEAGSRLNCIWGNCEGYPKGGAEDKDAFKTYIRQYQFPAQIFYSAYESLTVKDIELNEELADTTFNCLKHTGIQKLVTGNHDL